MELVYLTFWDGKERRDWLNRYKVPRDAIVALHWGIGDCGVTLYAPKTLMPVIKRHEERMQREQRLFDITRFMVTFGMAGLIGLIAWLVRTFA